MHTRPRNYEKRNFSSNYLERCKRESDVLIKEPSLLGWEIPYSNQKKSNDETNKEVYTKLVELDTRLGRKASEQLYECLRYTTRSDIIKVGGFLVGMKDLK